jgi:hypothetical protein
MLRLKAGIITVSVLVLLAMNAVSQEDEQLYSREAPPENIERYRKEQPLAIESLKASIVGSWLVIGAGGARWDAPVEVKSGTTITVIDEIPGRPATPGGGSGYFQESDYEFRTDGTGIVRYRQSDETDSFVWHVGSSMPVTEYREYREYSSPEKHLFVRLTYADGYVEIFRATFVSDDLLHLSTATFFGFMHSEAITEMERDQSISWSTFFLLLSRD